MEKKDHKEAVEQIARAVEQHGLNVVSVFGLLSVFQKHAPELGKFFSDLKDALSDFKGEAPDGG